MGSTKAPGYNGFPELFFQKYWHIMGKDIENFCLEVLNNGKDFEGVQPKFYPARTSKTKTVHLQDPMAQNN